MIDQQTYQDLREEINNNHKQMSIIINDDDYYQLPTIDMNQPDEIKIEQIVKQMTSIGFLVLENVKDFDEVIHYYWLKWFFNHTKEEKSKITRKPYNQESQNLYRGLVPFLDSDPSYKELYDFGQNYDLVSNYEKQFPLHEPNLYFEGDKANEFKEYIHQYYNNFKELGKQIMQYIAMGLNKPKDYFDKFLENDSLSTGRLIHYENRPDQQQQVLTKEDFKFTTPAHSDSAILTILSTFNFAGLQVEVNGDFKTIRPAPNVLIINLGDMIARMSGFQLKATVHRVLDLGCTRYSSPYFLEPNYTAQIPLNLFKDDKQTEFEYGRWLITAISQKYGEWQELLEEMDRKGFQTDDKKYDFKQELTN